MYIKYGSNIDEWLRTSRLSFKKGIGEEGEREQVYDVNIIENSWDKHVINYRVKRSLALATTDYLDAMTTGISQDDDSVGVENFSCTMMTITVKI